MVNGALPDRPSGERQARASISYGGDRSIVRVVGPADRSAIVDLSGCIRGLRAAGVRHLVVDLSSAFDCDRYLLTVLARARARLVDENGSLHVVGVELPSMLEALRSATPDEIFVLYDAIRREISEQPTSTQPRSQPRRAG